MITPQQNKMHHVLVFLLLALSGFPFFYMDPLVRPLLFGGFVFALLLFFNRKHARFDQFLLLYVFVFIVVSLGQVLTFGQFPVMTILGYLVRILLAYLVIRIVGKEFIRIYIRQLYFFSIISFFFYFGTLLNANVEHFFVQQVAPIFELPQSADAFYHITPNVLVFNFNSQLGDPTSMLRNSGPFWEPGAFSGFLIIALIFNLIMTRKLFSRYNVVFMIAIVTTVSTSGYIALFLVVIFYYFQLSNNLVKLLITPILIVGAFFSYYQLEFLGAKIERNQQSIATGNTSNRFISGLRDLDDIEHYWLFGRGMNELTRYTDSSYLQGQEKHRNNGVTALFVNMGILAGLLYFGLIRRSFSALCRYYGQSQYFAISALLVILVIGFSEGYFTKVFFISLTFLHLIYPARSAVRNTAPHETDLHRHSHV